jgi:hypothetical protein
MRLSFTPDRKLVRTNSLSGGVLPMPMINETTTEVNKVAVRGDAILLTLGATTFGRGGGVVSIRFPEENKIMLEDGPHFTRQE